MQLVFFNQGKIFTQQITHGALFKPLAMQTPFTAWSDKPVALQSFCTNRLLAVVDLTQLQHLPLHDPISPGNNDFLRHSSNGVVYCLCVGLGHS